MRLGFEQMSRAYVRVYGLFDGLLESFRTAIDDVDFCAVFFQGFRHHESDAQVMLAGWSIHGVTRELPLAPPVMTATRPVTPKRLATLMDDILFLV